MLLHSMAAAVVPQCGGGGPSGKHGTVRYVDDHHSVTHARHMWLPVVTASPRGVDRPAAVASPLTSLRWLVGVEFNAPLDTI